MIKQGLALIALGLLFTAPAFGAGQGAGGALAAAEMSYQNVDFPATREHARRALEAGGQNPEQTARLHVLLGISAAALGEADEAKQHFVVALAVDPSLRLDKSLSPKIRDPYLEAQGYWSASGERLALRATPTGDSAHLVIRLQDPASLVAKIELSVGAVGARERSPFVLVPSAVTRFAVPAQVRARDYEYVLRALDRHGNVLSERGSDPDPEIVRQQRSVAPNSEPPRAGRSYLLPAALAVAGAGAVATGIVFHVKREQSAHEWNGPHCENPGQTRQQQCQDVNSRIQASGRLAIGFYAAGGALLTGSVIALLAGRSALAPNERESALGCAIAGAGVSCLGHF